MRKEVYQAIKKTIEQDVPEVSHIDLWNHNVEFIEQEESWERPAVFVELGTISWSPYQGGGVRGVGQVHIHIVTDWAEGGQDASWDLSHQIYLSLEGLQGEHFNGMTLLSTDTNHNHEDILESIDTYALRYLLEQ